MFQTLVVDCHVLITAQRNGMSTSETTWSSWMPQSQLCCVVTWMWLIMKLVSCYHWLVTVAFCIHWTDSECHICINILYWLQCGIGDIGMALCHLCSSVCYNINGASTFCSFVKNSTRPAWSWYTWCSDIANPKTNTRTAGFTKEEREEFTNLLNEGFVDSFRHLYPDKTGAYTYWSYMGNAREKNVGWWDLVYMFSHFMPPNLGSPNLSDPDIFRPIGHLPST